MAQSLNKAEDIRIFIPEAITQEGVTKYVIQVIIGDVEWTTQKRYREFNELHETLLDSGVDKDCLPEKKLIGNKEPAFIKKRRKDLETYLQSIFNFLKRSLPQSLLTFLDFPLHDTHHVLRALASTYYTSVESGKPAKAAEWTPLEIHAISERLKAPRPPEDSSEDEEHAFVNVADFACQLEALKISGSTEKLGNSNIVPNNLRYDFLAFKSLTRLKLVNVTISSDKIATFGLLRKTLIHFTANECSLASVSALLLGDTPHSSDSNVVNNWEALQFLDLRQNELTCIDASINLAPNLRTLILGYNKIARVENLEKLTQLCTLELAANQIEEVDDLHKKLGQISRLDLSNNKIRSVAGCCKLFGLAKLNVAGNKINDLDNVFPASKLPHLESFNLQGNHVTTVVDYRIKVFESFGKRCTDLCLDNELPTQQEIDKVSVLMALRVAREGKSPTSLFGNLPRRL